MTDQSPILSPATSKDTRECISSPESGDGTSPSISPDGEDARSGPAPVPVSRFRALERDRAKPTNDISGPLFTASSPSADLQSCLENRLRERLAGNGSALYALTWRTWDMPAGPQISALRGLVLRISANVCTGWPTPMAGTPAQNGYNAAGSTDSSRKTVELVAGWVSPTAQDHSRGTKPPRPTDTGIPLSQQVAWATPTSRDHKDGASTLENTPVNGLLGRQVLGMTLSGSDAEMEDCAPLNPAFVRWLMGYPPEWDECAVTATPSSRRLRRNS